jgi:NitT/TauT family transport system ATP-binding protein
LQASSERKGLSIRNVTLAYRPPRGQAVTALDGVTLDIEDREFVALLGPSGCGKSTLLYLIGGFLHADSGSIVANGRAVEKPGPDRGIVFQDFALFPWKTVRENVLYGLEKKGVPKKERQTIADHYLRLVHLKDFENSYPSQLSGGMKQRVAIARTLAIQPEILLLDEPFGALDSQTRSIMQEELRSIWSASPMTVVFVTHDVREAVYLADRVAVMSARPGIIKEIVDTRADGKLIADVSKDPAFIEKVDYIWSLVRTDARDLGRDRAH